MSLSTWSYSNYADMKPMDSTAPTVARKKVTKATKFVPPPPATSDDEASLADFHAEPSDEEDERAPTRTEMAFLKKAPPALSASSRMPRAASNSPLTSPPGVEP